MSLKAEWNITETFLERRWQLKNFREALALVNAIGAIAEAQKHHPDISFGWGRVQLKITTHDQGHTLTEKDFALARAIDLL